MGDLFASAQAAALVVVAERADLLVNYLQAALFGQACDKHARAEGEMPAAISVLLQAVYGFAVDRDVLHVGGVAGAERGQLKSAGAASSQG